MESFSRLPEHLWGMRKIDDLQHRYGHRLLIQPVPDEVQMWRLELIHRHGVPLIRIETNRLAPAFASLLTAADLQGFWEEPAEWEKGL
jgi:hypothetical protein